MESVTGFTLRKQPRARSGHHRGPWQVSVHSEPAVGVWIFAHLCDEKGTRHGIGPMMRGKGQGRSSVTCLFVSSVEMESSISSFTFSIMHMMKPADQRLRMSVFSAKMPCSVL